MLAWPKFILAGNAIFTVKSPSGKHYTFRVNSFIGRTGDMVHTVGYLNGPDNLRHYEWFGNLNAETGRTSLTAKARAKGLTEKTEAIKAGCWAIYHLMNEMDMNGCEVSHAMRCCRCKRPLTTPTSTANGYGDDCAKYIFGE